MNGQKLGDLTIQSATEENLFYQRPVYDNAKTQSGRAFFGIAFTNLDAVEKDQPEWLWKPSSLMEPVRLPGRFQQVLTLQYQDLLAKAAPLSHGYRVTVYIEYVEVNPAVEAIPDAAVRQQIYDGAISHSLYRFPCP